LGVAAIRRDALVGRTNYQDKDNVWHEYYEQDGTWHDEWTDLNGNQHHGQVDQWGNWVDTWTDENGKVHGGYFLGDEWHEWEAGIELQSPWTPFTDSQGNEHYMTSDQYGRQWSWYRDNQGVASIGYTDCLDGLWHEYYEQDGTWFDRWTDLNGNRNLRHQDARGAEHKLLEADGVTYDTWKVGDRVYESWRGEHGLQAYGYRDENGNWRGWHKASPGDASEPYDLDAPGDSWEPDDVDAKGLWWSNSYDGPGLPPGVQDLRDVSMYRGELGRLYYRAVDEYGRRWEWTLDDQGNPVAWSYRDLVDRRNENHPDQQGVCWDSWTDWNGNRHHGKVDQYGNVQDSWTDENGNVHDEVHPPGTIGEGEQRPPKEEPRPLPPMPSG